MNKKLVLFVLLSVVLINCEDTIDTHAPEMEQTNTLT